MLHKRKGLQNNLIFFIAKTNYYQELENIQSHKEEN